MKSIDLIRRVNSALSFLQFMVIGMAVLATSAYVFSFSEMYFSNGIQEVDLQRKLTYEQVDALIEAGVPLINSKPFIIKDGIRETLTFSGERETTSRYTVNDTILLHPRSWKALLRLSFGLLYVLFIIYGIYLLKKLLQNTATKTPFIQENVAIIRRLAYLIFFYVFIGWFSRSVITELIKQSIQEGYSFSLKVGFSSSTFSILILGFLILILASVFERGIELKEEVALTI